MRVFVKIAPTSARLCWVLLVALALACGRSSGVAPTPPPGPSPTLTSVNLGGLPGLIPIGQSVQLYAIAQFSDNTTMIVTSDATFASMRPDIATVSAQGLLTAVSPGQGMVRVDYKTVSGEWRIDIVGPGITGQIREVSARNICLASARLEITDGGAKGYVVTADDDGRFTFPGLETLAFTLSVSKTGYATTQVPLDYPRVTSADIALTPTARIVQRVWDGTLAPDQCGLPNLADGVRSLLITASADGVITINAIRMQVSGVGFFELRRGSQTPPPECRPSRPGVSAVYSVTRGVEYELRVRGRGCGAGTPYDGSFHVEFSGPE